MSNRILQLNQQAHEQARRTYSFVSNAKWRTMRLKDLSITELHKEIDELYDSLLEATNSILHVNYTIHDQERYLQSAILDKLIDNKQIELNYYETEEMLKQYISASTERSMYKSIPIKYFEACKKYFKATPTRYKFRGKSIPEIGFKRDASHISKMYATTFAIYRG
jgi:hypothetical protein